LLLLPRKTVETLLEKLLWALDPKVVASIPTPSTAPFSADSAVEGNNPLLEALDRGLKRTGEHSYEIQRGTLESVLLNSSLLLRSACIVLEIRHGKTAGFRLDAVKPGGPLARLGIQSGDVISTINGIDITSPERAREIYAELKSASHLALGIERNGQRVTTGYDIR
jgi:general secretion pathway protein C